MRRANFVGVGSAARAAYGRDFYKRGGYTEGGWEHYVGRGYRYVVEVAFSSREKPELRVCSRDVKETCDAAMRQAFAAAIAALESIAGAS